MTEANEITIEGQFESRIAEECDAMEGYAVGELRNAIRESIISIWDHCYRIAAAVRLLQRAGEDLSFLQEGWGKWALLLAKCRVLPETLKTFSHKPALLNEIAKMPLESQAEIVKDKPIEIVQTTGAIKLVKPTELSRKDISKAFKNGTRRTIAEQRRDFNDKYHTEIDPEVPRLPIGIPIKDLMPSRLHPGTQRNGAFIKLGDKSIFLTLRELEGAISFLRNGGLD